MCCKFGGTTRAQCSKTLGADLLEQSKVGLLQISGQPTLNTRRTLTTDLLEQSKVDVLQIWGNPHLMLEGSFVAASRSRRHKADVLQTTGILCSMPEGLPSLTKCERTRLMCLQIRATRAQCHEGPTFKLWLMCC